MEVGQQGRNLTTTRIRSSTDPLCFKFVGDLS